MKLAEMLRDLTALLPHRLTTRTIPVRSYHVTSYHGIVDGSREYLGCVSTLNTLDQPGENWQQQVALEGALREECEARGWCWTVERTDWPHLPPIRAAVAAQSGWQRIHYAPTAGEALAGAMLSALQSAEVKL